MVVSPWALHSIFLASQSSHLLPWMLVLGCVDFLYFCLSVPLQHLQFQLLWVYQYHFCYHWWPLWSGIWTSSMVCFLLIVSSTLWYPVSNQYALWTSWVHEWWWGSLHQLIHSKLPVCSLCLVLTCNTLEALHLDHSSVTGLCVVLLLDLPHPLVGHTGPWDVWIIQLQCIPQHLHCRPAIQGSGSLWMHACSFSFLLLVLICIFSMLVALPCESQVHCVPFHRMLQGWLVEWFHLWPVSFLTIQWYPIRYRSTLVCNCWLTSLLALVMLIRVGGLSCYKWWQSSLACCCCIRFGILLSVFFFFFFLRYVVNLRYVCLCPGYCLLVA